MNVRLILLLAISLYACKQSTTGQTQAADRPSLINEWGKIIETRFDPPPGYRRGALPDGSFGKYLRGLPLKPHGSPVLYYNGDEKPNNNIYSGVVAMDIGKHDLQQCADAIMRLRAEYLYSSKQTDKIHFNFTSGFRMHLSGSTWKLFSPMQELCLCQENYRKWITRISLSVMFLYKEARRVMP